MWRHIASNAVTLLLVGLFLLGGLILWGRAQRFSAWVRIMRKRPKA